MFDYTPHPTVLAHVEILVQPNFSQKLTWNIHEIDEQALAKFKIETPSDFNVGRKWETKYEIE